MKQLFFQITSGAALLLLLSGCAAPIGATHSSTKAVYEQMDANALSSGKPSASTEFLLHRYQIDRLFAENPGQAVIKLHERAVSTGERELLFALSEMSFLAGEDIRRSLKPWEQRDARDYYLATAAYAYLFLFGDHGDKPDLAFDRRFRTACDLYNFGLGLALAQPRATNGAVVLRPGQRQLPVGQVDLQIDSSALPFPVDKLQEFVLGDQYRVRGLSARNREPGLGATLIGVALEDFGAGLKSMTALTAFVRFDGDLKSMSSGTWRGVVELYSAFGTGMVKVGNQNVPLETDMSVHIAYGLNQGMVWKLHWLQFMSLEQTVRSGVYFSQPYERGRIPVVFVHGTMSSPVWWAEMLNTLRADPELRQRYQLWFYTYNSSAPMLVSAARLRQSIAERLQQVDPAGTDEALKRMVVIGHSQGGLLTKMIATETGDRLWRSVSQKPVEELKLTDKEKDDVRHLFYLTPVPEVGRVVFISTPHRGSYRAAGLARRLTRRLVEIPKSLTEKLGEARSLLSQMNLPSWIDKRKITSIDGMSPKSPMIRALADIPVAPPTKAHSIIAIRGDGDYHTASDGVVKYESAHVDYVESELVVRSGHSCQSTPEAIEEVRRILHEHLTSSPNPTRQ